MVGVDASGIAASQTNQQACGSSAHSGLHYSGHFNVCISVGTGALLCRPICTTAVMLGALPSLAIVSSLVDWLPIPYEYSDP